MDLDARGGRLWYGDGGRSQFPVQTSRQSMLEHPEAIEGAGPVGLWAEAPGPVSPGRSWIAKMCRSKSGEFADFHGLRIQIRAKLVSGVSQA